MTPELLLVCGAAESDEIWADVIGGLPAARVLELPSSSDLDALTDFVTASIRTDAILVGHSLGAAVSVLAAAQARARVQGVVLVASGASLPVHPAVWATLADGGERAVAARLASAAGSANGSRAARDTAPRMEAMFAGARPGTLERHLRACATFDAPEIRLPATVLAGCVDRLVGRALSEELARRTGASLTMLPDIGHQIPWDAPGAVLDAVHKLIDEVESGAVARPS